MTNMLTTTADRLRRIAAFLLTWLCVAGRAEAYNMGGLQVWVPDRWDTTGLGTYYGPNFEIMKMKPACMAGFRNGTFSCYIVATSCTGPIEGLKATMGDLVAKGTGAKMPASAVRVRYARPAHPSECWVPWHRFDALIEEVPATVPVVQVNKSGNWTPEHVGPIAMQPIWVTVNVPSNAAPGEYEGLLTVESDVDQVPDVKVILHVADWPAPNPSDFRIINLALESQEAVARHYGVPLWSDRHLELMGESLKLLAQVNSRQVSLNLTQDFYGAGGNEETMVRWVKSGPAAGEGKGPQQYTYDYSALDKYLDLAARTVGKPNLIRINCWMEWGPKDRNAVAATNTWQGKAAVTLFDPATGKLEDLEYPRADSPEFVPFWRPVLDEVFKKLESRGWLDVTAFGANSYCWGVHPEIIDAAHVIRPDAVWAYTSHNGGMGGRFRGTKPEVSMLCKYPEHIWGPGPGARDSDNRGYRTLFDERPTYLFHTMRNQFWDFSELRIPRSVVERCVGEGHDGVSDFGGDLFPIPNPRRLNTYYKIGNGRGTGGPNCSTTSLLAPGPNGAVATERFEAFREGLQICEAILFAQKCINSGKLSAELAARANAALNERGRRMKESFVLADKSGALRYDFNHQSENSFEREKELFAVAAEAARQTGL
jgi:hypothetical protein